jgi:transposase
MMGPSQERETKLFHYGINLDKRVRWDNPLRQIDGAVDFGFVRQELKDCYGKDGHESEDPIVIMKLMLLLFLDDISSERELMRIVPERIDYLWFLKFDLDDEIPNHSVLSKARRRWGRGIFEEAFVRIVKSCVEAGLVDGKKIHMDGSLVNANASRDSVHQGPAELIAALRKAYQREQAKLDDTGDDESGGRRRGKAIATTVSKTDPDAAIVRKGKADVARPRYKNHRSVDDQCGVITGLCTTAGDVGEDQKLMELVEQHENHTGQKVTTVVGDTQYGTNENFAACQQRGIQSHMSDLRSVYIDSGSRKGIFKEEEFVYDPQTDTYRCPAGKQLKRTPNPDPRFLSYKGNRQMCADCPLRSQCTRSKKWRTIRRHIHHEQIQRGRAESRSGWGKRDRKRRMHLMEGSFGDAAVNHGFKRSRWRGLQRQNIQDLLIATCQNIRMLLRYGRQLSGLAVAVALPVQRIQIIRAERCYPIGNICLAASFRRKSGCYSGSAGTAIQTFCRS